VPFSGSAFGAKWHSFVESGSPVDPEWAQRSEGGFQQHQSSPSGSQPAGKSRVLTVTPATIHQVMSAADQHDGFVLNGKELGNVFEKTLRLCRAHLCPQVAIVGIIRRVDAKPTKVVYTVDDHTGQIDSVLWINAEDEESTKNEKLSECREGIYVRLVGSIKTVEERRTLTCFHVAPVKDSNEITHHLLDVTMNFLRATNVHAPVCSLPPPPAVS
jgi:replication factor A2